MDGPTALNTVDGALQATQVDLTGLLDLLGSHLYSTPAVAVREVVQNAQDSITLRRIEDPGWTGGAISVTCEPEARRMTIVDDGAGMTGADLSERLATIGAGATRDARTATGSEDLIGMFGVGFLSAFSVADRVVVHSTPHRAAGEGWEYRSQDGHRYTVRSVRARARPGSSVTLELKAEHADLARAEHVRAILRHYCRLLRIPVALDGDDEPVNVDPPWRAADGVSPHPVRARRARMAFAESQATGFGPLCALDVPAFDGTDVRGVLWVHDGATYGTTDHRELEVHVRGMLVDDDARDLLPRWAGFTSGIVESDLLRPTASREDLHRDDVYAATADALREALVRGLQRVATDEPEAWRRILRRHGQALTGAALVDDRLFDLLAQDLLLPTSDGDLPAGEIARRGDGKVHVGLNRGGFEEMLFRTLGTPIADGSRYGVLAFLRAWCQARRRELVEVGGEGDRAIFRPATLEAGARAWVEATFARDGWVVLPAHFEPRSLPFVVVPDRAAALKSALEADDADARMGAAALRLARVHTTTLNAAAPERLYVNVDNPAVSALLAAPEGPCRERATRVLHAVLVILSVASGAKLEPDELRDALDDTARTITALLEAD